MADIFLRIVNRSLSATWLVLAVVSLRFLLRKAPKWVNVLLWGMVALRLICPFTLESTLSLIPSAEVIPQEIMIDATPEIQTGIASVNRVVNPIITEAFAPEPIASANPLQILIPIFSWIWCLGMGLMMLYAAITYWQLHRKLRMAIHVKRNVFLSEDIPTPFVLGIFRPRIYLPYHMSEDDRRHVLAHERAHIYRRDHWWKPLGFLLLSVHWFNPAMWLAYILLCRDIELACDERVVQKLPPNLRADYSQALLNCSIGRHAIAVCPLAFGEVGIRERVRNVLHYKRPAFWVTVLCLVVCILFGVCFLTDPLAPFPSEFQQYFRIGEKAELLSGRTEENPSGTRLTVTYKETSGPIILNLELWYQEGADNSWIPMDAASLEIADSCEFHLPSGCTFAVAATAKDGQGGYAAFEVSAQEGIVFDKFEYDFLAGSNTKSASFDASAWTIPFATQETTALEQPDWGVSIAPERVTRTGATAAFVYGDSVPGQDGAELYYGDFLSLERLDESGNWAAVAELPGYEYYVGDSSYPVVDGYGMVHEWQDRFGVLPNGTYRIGKAVTLVRPDGSQENQIIYGEFSLPDAIATEPIALDDLPERYSAEQAMLDGCIVQEDGVIRENKERFQEFVANSWNGIPSYVRIFNYHHGEHYEWSVVDLRFDGSVYTITGESGTYTYRYLKQYTGEKAWENAEHDGYEYFILVNEEAASWEDIQNGNLPNSHDLPAHWTVYTDFTYLPKKPQLPTDPMEAILEFEGEPLVTITDFDRLEKIWLLFENAEFLGYEPKTHSIGLGLNLILTSQSGETMTIELDPDNDICRINGEFVFYGAFDEPNYIEKLWYYLALSQWPEAVYQRYPNAWKP